MTLAEWSAMSGIRATIAGDKLYVPLSQMLRTVEHELWRLTDYRVDGLSGGVVWLAPSGHGVA